MNPLLRDLAEADASKQAPPRVEEALLAAYRAKQRAPRRRYWWLAVAAAAASVILAIVTVQKREVPVPPPPRPVAQVAVVQVPPAPVVAQPKPVVRHRKAPRPAPPPEEIVTEFIPVTPGEPIPPDETPRVVRVRMPAAALASFGFSVDAERAMERVQADVMLRQDGSPSAIRLVNAAEFR